MIEQCGYEFIIKGLVALAISLLFLLNGFTLSAIPPWKDIVTEEQLVRGCCLLSIIYFIVFTILGMIDDHHGIFLIITFILFFMSTMASCGFLAKTDEYNPISWIVPAYISGLIIVCKLLYTSYYLIEKAIINDLDLEDDETHFLFNSMIMELLLSLFYSLAPYLIHYRVNTDENDKIFTIWAYEYCDVVSHLIVALSYAKELNHGWDNILTAYYIIYAINAVIWALPMPLIPLIEKFAMYHMIFSDIVTDIPMLAVTIYSKSFVGNAYITVDIVVKAIVFTRALCYVPITHGYCQCLKNDTKVDNPYNKF